jgi:hypothetical protein
MIDMNADDFAHPMEDELREDDREWRALRYVLGEMSPVESEDFEHVLATDQETRELVARSTGLVTSLLDLSVPEATANEFRNGSPPAGSVRVSTAWVRPAESPELMRRRSARFGGWTVAGLSAAVCLCIAVGLCLLPFGSRNVLEDIYSGDTFDSGAGHLVAIWSQRLAELAPEPATTEPAASDRPEFPLPGEADDSRLATATENAPADSAAVGDQIAADDSDVPGWMIAAVELGPIRHLGGSSSEIREN